MIKPIPKPKPKPCKACQKRPKLQGRTLCYTCLKAKEKAKRLASEAKKKERKLNSKGYKVKQTKKLEKECDRLWSLVVREVKTCQLCGKKGDKTSFDAHHLTSRRKKVTRWDLNNGACLCKKCHIFGVHKDTLEASLLIDKLKTKRGDVWYEELECKRWMMYKPTLEDLEKIEKELKSKLNI